MSNWHISESGTTVELDDEFRGEALFTVQNAATGADRVVLTNSSDRGTPDKPRA